MTDAPRSLEAAGHAWWVDPALEGWVRDVLAPRARAPAELPAARVVKDNRVRTVVRAPGPEGTVYCKRFRTLRPLDRLLSPLRASPARREWRAMRRLAAAGIACPQPLVLGEEARGGLLRGSVLVTREAAGWREVTAEIDARRADPARAGERRALVEALARACERLFAAGADHPDLHLANFLVRGGGEVLVLDLHSVRLRRGALGRRARLRRLGKVAHSFGPADPAKEAWAREEIGWLAAASAALQPDLGPPERLADDLLRRARGEEATRLASRDRRCLVTSTGYVKQGPRGRRVYRRREVTAQAVWLALDEPAQDVVHAHPRGRSRIETLLAPPSLERDGPVIVRKLYLFPHVRARLAGIRAPLALRAWQAARACEVRGIPTPRHYALVLEGAVPRRATILMERVRDATMVHVWLEEGSPAPAARRRLARELGGLLGRFHASGLQHRDLALQNLLIRPREGDGRAGWDLWIVDLDEVRATPMRRKDKLRALAQLADLPPAATRADRLRFFRAYLEAGGREVLASELEAWGEVGLGRRVGRLLARKAAAKARRQARGVARPEPTNVSALRG